MPGRREEDRQRWRMIDPELPPEGFPHLDVGDLTRDQFSVRGKGEKVRVVFLSASAKKAVAEYLKKRGDLGEALFVSYGRAQGKTKDLPRFNGRALIGDKRNDENVIISQLHGVFLRFHNVIADELKKHSAKITFEDVQRLVRWHYQWIVLHDFLPKIVGCDILNEVLPHLKDSTSINTVWALGSKAQGEVISADAY